LGFFETLFFFFVDVIAAGGYWGVFILMGLESMVAPVPSEAVMPFAGYLVAIGKFNMITVIISSGMGSITGSLISYFIGLKGGKPLVLRFGKYLLLDLNHLDATERFFSRYGEKAIFICRFIPVVRHFISIPAGVGKMDLAKFCIYTIVGATIWNAILAFVGLWLGEKWGIVHHYSRYLDLLVVVLAALGIIYLIRRRKRLREGADVPRI
jgi:membrane protein DedA with SNARE-associated domain